MIRLRRMDPADLEPVALLERACFAAPWSRDALAGELTGGNTVLLTAWLDGALAGYACMRLVLDEGEILKVAVAPHLRRRGVAGALLESLLEQGRARGLRALLLEVRASNTPALTLYQGHGFRQVGLRRGYYRLPTEDAVLMTLEL